jgi:hypothetical protein
VGTEAEQSALWPSDEFGFLRGLTRENGVSEAFGVLCDSLGLTRARLAVEMYRNSAP